MGSRSFEDLRVYQLAEDSQRGRESFLLEFTIHRVCAAGQWSLGGNTINRELQRNGVGSRFRATINHMESGLPENDSRPLPRNAYLT
jgi:hypothetical protein